jgi:hypothetical protein
MVRDVERDADLFRRGAAWNLVDYLPDFDAPLQKRGGWSYASNDISQVKATASYVVGGIYAPFSTPKNLAIDEDGELYSIASNGTVTDIGLAVVPIAQLSFHRGLVIITNSNGTSAVKSYDGTTLQSLAGSPPACKYSAVYKDLLVLANKSGNEQTLYFSGDGSPTSGFDTANRYVNISFPITGLAALRNALLVFSNQQVERIIGTTPPPGGDMARQVLFQPGCVDARSILIYEDNCVFANTQGVYMTDGTVPVDLTDRMGMKKYWRETMGSYTSSWTIAGFRARTLVGFSIMNGSTFVDCIVFDLAAKRSFRFSNFRFTSAWNTIGAAAETYVGYRLGARVGYLSTIFSPGASNKNDADGTAVTPVLETGWTKIGDAPSRIQDVYVTYDLRDAASDNPTLSVSYVLTPEATLYSNATDSAGSDRSFAESVSQTRARARIRKTGRGVALRVTQTNASAATKLYDLALTGHAREASRLA